MAPEADKNATAIYNGVLGACVPTTAASLAHCFIVYAALGRVQASKELGRALAVIADSPTLNGRRLRFVGTGSLEPKLRDRTSLPGLSHQVGFLRPPIKTDAMKMSHNAGLLILRLDRKAALFRAIRSNLLERLVAARPIVDGLLGEAQSTLESTKGRLCAESQETDAIARVLFQAINIHQTVLVDSPGNRELLSCCLTGELVVSVLASSLKHVVARTAAAAQQNPV